MPLLESFQKCLDVVFLRLLLYGADEIKEVVDFNLKIKGFVFLSAQAQAFVVLVVQELVDDLIRQGEVYIELRLVELKSDLVADELSPVKFEDFLKLIVFVFFLPAIPQNDNFLQEIIPFLFTLEIPQVDLFVADYYLDPAVIDLQDALQLFF